MMRFLVTAVVVCALLSSQRCLEAEESASINSASDDARYETREDHDRYGIGKFYMGREIARVMGHQGIPWLERDNREEEERLSELLSLLEIEPGDAVADIGAGSGVITMSIADLVGAKGTIYAVDIQPEMLAAIKVKTDSAGIDHVELVRGTTKDPKLPPNSCDLAFMVDVYHEFDFPYEMLQGIVDGLKPGGRVAFVEYRKEDRSIPIIEVHKMSEAQVKKEALQSVFRLKHVKTDQSLPRQHVITFEKMAASE